MLDVLTGVIWFTSPSGFFLRSARFRGDGMTAWYVVCGVVALLLLAYLFVAMLKPESFQ